MGSGVEIAGLPGAYGDLMGGFSMQAPPGEGSGGNPEVVGTQDGRCSPILTLPQKSMSCSARALQNSGFQDSSPRSKDAAGGLSVKPDGPILHLGNLRS